MPLSPRFVEAVAYAAQAHAAQVRKQTGIPYLAHLLAVAAIALEYGADEEEAIAALLHDVIEDHGERHREPIRARFGDRVLAIVLACSDSEGEPKPPWRERKERYLSHLAAADESVHLVSASDKLHNLRSILRDYRLQGDLVWQRFRGGRDGTLWYYHRAVELLQKAPDDLRAELRLTLDTLQALLNGASSHPH
jgi:GTP pyrophosphokinase